MIKKSQLVFRKTHVAAGWSACKRIAPNSSKIQAHSERNNVQLQNIPQVISELPARGQAVRSQSLEGMWRKRENGGSGSDKWGHVRYYAKRVLYYR
eukprot:2274022-Rhodomonas_salina.2